jgi:hypothetical protein
MTTAERLAGIALYAPDSGPSIQPDERLNSQKNHEKILAGAVERMLSA